MFPIEPRGNKRKTPALVVRLRCRSHMFPTLLELAPTRHISGRVTWGGLASLAALRPSFRQRSPHPPWRRRAGGASRALSGWLTKQEADYRRPLGAGIVNQPPPLCGRSRWFRGFLVRQRAQVVLAVVGQSFGARGEGRGETRSTLSISVSKCWKHRTMWNFADESMPITFTCLVKPVRNIEQRGMFRWVDANQLYLLIITMYSQLSANGHS